MTEYTKTEIKELRLIVYRGSSFDMWGVNHIQTVNDKRCSVPIIPPSLTLNEAIWAAHGYNCARRTVNANRGLDLETLPIEVQT